MVWFFCLNLPAVNTGMNSVFGKSMKFGNSRLAIWFTTRSFASLGVFSLKKFWLVDIHSLKFINRLLSMNIDQQNTTFAAFEEQMDEIVQAHAAAGTLDTGIKTLRAKRIDKANDKRGVHRRNIRRPGQIHTDQRGQRNQADILGAN